MNKKYLEDYITRAQTLQSKKGLIDLLSSVEDLMDRAHNGYSNYLPSEVAPVLKKVREIVTSRIEIKDTSKEQKIIECIKHHLKEAHRDLPTESSLFANDLLIEITSLETNEEFLADAFFNAQQGK